MVSNPLRWLILMIGKKSRWTHAILCILCNILQQLLHNIIIKLIKHFNSSNLIIDNHSITNKYTVVVSDVAYEVDRKAQLWQ